MKGFIKFTPETREIVLALSLMSETFQLVKTPLQQLKLQPLCHFVYRHLGRIYNTFFLRNLQVLTMRVFVLTWFIQPILSVRPEA
jgi:hypothetical protein